MMRSVFRRTPLFVGVVLLAVSAMACELLASEAPVKRVDGLTDDVVDGNSQFAVDLYRQMAKEHVGKNLFFSPYSISGTMAMAVDGARGETAEQMGRVLQLPASTKRTGDDAEWIPFETAKIHAAIASINRELTAQDQSPEAKQARARIAVLRAKHEEIKAEYEAMWQPPEGVEEGEDYLVPLDSDKESTLHFDEAQLIRELDEERSKVDQYEIRISNTFWLERDYPFREEFLKTIDRHYGADSVFRADFKHRPEEARQGINEIVAKQTKNRIRAAIPPDMVNKYTRLVLTGAIYFRGDWPTPFWESRTEDKPFELADGTQVTTPIMFKVLSGGGYAAFNADGSFFTTPRWTYKDSTTGELQPREPLYPDADGFAMVEMPYRGDRLSMVVIAPNAPKGLPAIEAKLSAENLKEWIGRLDDRKVRLHLPKFKMETAYTLGDGEYGPKGTLPDMGMVRAFTDGLRFRDGAQFDGISTPTDPRDRLFISKVLHRATIEVNEKGTEATAATIVIMRSGSANLRKVPFDPTFRADRPFLFLIRDTESGTILFLGRLMKP